MAIWNSKHSGSSDNSPHRDHEFGKSEYQAGAYPATPDGRDDQPVDHTHLHRGLKARHITMIAIGGAIGTGLIVCTFKLYPSEKITLLSV